MANAYRFADFEFDRLRGELRRGGARVPLEPKVVDVLSYLLNHRTRAVPIDELLTAVWGDIAVERGSVHRAIRILRTALRDAHLETDAVETLRGRGYRFNLAVEEVETAPRGQGKTLGYVGRHDVCEELDARLERAFRGSTEVVLLHGPAGIGKSATLKRLARSAGRGRGIVLEGRCIEGPAAPPYRPWLRILRGAVALQGGPAVARGLGYGAEDVARALPELASKLGFDATSEQPLDPGARYRVQDAFGEWIHACCRRQPLLLMIDDLHRADLDSIQLLGYLLQEIKDEPLLFLISYRDGPDAERVHEELGQIVSLHPRAPLALGELSRSDVEEFALDRTGEHLSPEELDDLADASGGNPLFLEQLLHARGTSRERADPRSAGLRGALQRLLDSASEPCGEVLAFASVLGREFDPIVVAAGLEVGTAEVQRAIGEGLELRILEAEQDATIRFVHGLMPEVLYAGLAAPRRVDLHRRAVDAILATRAGLREHLNELAHHAREAVEAVGIERAFELGLEAGREAVRRLAYEEATTIFERTLAIRAPREAGARVEAARAECLVELGDVLVRRGIGQEARPHFLEACELARSVGDAELFARAAIGPSVLEEYAQDDDAHIAELEEAIERLGDGDSEMRVRLLTALATTGYLADRERTLRSSLEALEMARRLEAPALVCSSAVARANALGWTNRREECAELVREAGTIARHGSIPPMTKGVALRYAAFEALVGGERGLYETHVRSLERLAASQHLQFFDWRVAAMRTTLMLTDGDFEGARRVVREQFARGQHANPRLAFMIVGVQAAMIELAVGEPEGVAKSLQAFVDSPEGLITWRAPLALALARCGRFAEAADRVEPLVRVGFEPRHRDFLPMVLATFAEAVQMMGHREYARVVGEELAQLGDRCVVLGLCLATYGAVDRYRGLCAETLGDYDEAIDLYERGLELDEAMSSPPFVASGLRDLGRVLCSRGAAGDVDRADAVLRRARELARGMGMQHVVDDVDALSH